jgi:Zn-dependent M28 family amino/carboxypeptidase
MTYTATVTKNPINGRFDVMVAAVGGTEVYRHGSYATYKRADAEAKKIRAA